MGIVEQESGLAALGCLVSVSNRGLKEKGFVRKPIP